MFHFESLFTFVFIFFPLNLSTAEMNLHHTKWVSERENSGFEHDCFRVPAFIEVLDEYLHMVSYCMSELPSKFDVETNDYFPKFRFDELSKENITSEQLYHWSAPIDLIEDYQFYLNHLSKTNDSTLGKQVFYNCTMPRFGSMCQYEFVYQHQNDSSLYQIIAEFYHSYQYNPTSFTCYDHLKCNRGPSPSCLDWSEICNGKVECLDSGIDEEYCWQLYTNECKDNEYQCLNGQCIPQAFYDDDIIIPDCFDASDAVISWFEVDKICSTMEPSFGCEDTIPYQALLTSYRLKNREDLLLQALFSTKNNGTSDECWSALKYLILKDILSCSMCDNLCKNETCFQLTEATCPDMLYIPSVPVLFGDIYFAYYKNGSKFLEDRFSGYPYVCYHNSLYDDYFVNASKIFFNNTMCYYIDHPIRVWIWEFPQGFDYLKILKRDLWEYNRIGTLNQTFNFMSTLCKRTNMYQCSDSFKCIPKSRRMDNTNDCPHGDDEIIPEGSYAGNSEDDSNKIILYVKSDNDLGPEVRYALKNPVFQIICDGFIGVFPRNINGRNETDETECQQWECNNIYTQCTGSWNCADGSDEIGCISYPKLNCSWNDHICVSPKTNKLMCLPIEKANDGKIDCLGATDEPTLCRTMYVEPDSIAFHCMGSNTSSCLKYGDLCDGIPDCSSQDDEQFCTTNRTYLDGDPICAESSWPVISDVETFFCKVPYTGLETHIPYFSLNGMHESNEDLKENVEEEISSNSFLVQMFAKDQPRCHRGIDLRVWLNNENNLTRRTCLCPPSYYGDHCQYQNDRVSLTIKFQAVSDSWQTLFSIIILLIDNSDERIIHSYEQLTYLSFRDCAMKFHIYLLYSTRPKDLTKNYSIHVDIYEKVSLTYRGSFLYPIRFPFLPVYRLVLIINIPPADNKIQSCFNKQCGHGKCLQYLNSDENVHYCRCDAGWSGKYCTIEHSCQCSLDSLCLGVSANNRSICLCPTTKFGPRCLLVDLVCGTNENSSCLNGGQCIPHDDYTKSDQKFTCICPQGFIGDYCEIINNALVLSFGKEIVLSPSIFVHFIEVVIRHDPVRATTFRTTNVKKDLITIYWSRPFHLVFIELSNKSYYLAVVQKNYERSKRIVKTINLSNRCPPISELFNETFVQWDILRRIKYYHLPCQRQEWNLSCFYDELHLCLCYDFNQKRLANCFEFDHNMTFDCVGHGVCENGGQCFQDREDCPERSICHCLSCYYGTRCQFSTSGFGLSLDAILGYQILSNVSLNDQPFIIKISLASTIIFIIIGLINGVLCMITFKNKVTREVGCGIYLLGSSITTILTMFIFGLKFFILLLSQMTLMSNQLFLQVQCHSVDFLLRVCLSMDQWLNACVAVERAVTTIKGTRFEKKKSKRAAKFVVILLLIIIVGSHIHDPIYRRLINEGNDDDDVKRVWCIISSRPGLEIYNYVVQTFHFVGPVIVNLISAIILITKKSRQQANLHTHRTYKEILLEQFRTHKHLLTAPIVLVILALPRLILAFVSKCMESADHFWLFLVGYFISFIPTMLTFIVFIVPSKFYKAEFHKSVRQYRTNLQRRLHLMP